MRGEYFFRKNVHDQLPVGNSEFFVASDIPAILKYTNKIIFLDNFEIASLAKDRAKITDYNKKSIKRRVCNVYNSIWVFFT